MILTQRHLNRLANAVKRDETLENGVRASIRDAIGRLAPGDALPDDLTDAGDGRTPNEVVAVALEFYGLS